MESINMDGSHLVEITDRLLYSDNKMKFILPLFLLVGIACSAQTNSYLLRVYDDKKDEAGYINAKGDSVIPTGKYIQCYTDTFKTYAIVGKAPLGIYAINRSEESLYRVFMFDNWPDEPANGLFRIEKDGLVGYADVKTGQVVILPKYQCAYPFENGKAQVSLKCTKTFDGDHTAISGGNWFYINTKGEVVK